MTKHSNYHISHEYYQIVMMMMISKGEIVLKKTKVTTKYVPPHLRKNDEIKVP